MPYVTERWPGGMLTNFPTIRKAIKKMNTIDKMISDGTFETLAKREKLQVTRQRAKLEKNLGSIADLNRLPSALFVVDVQKEANAVKEARKLNIPVIAMVDTCCDPTPIDFVIPANDDASKSIEVVVNALCGAIQEGLEERKLDKEKAAAEEEKRAKEKELAKMEGEKVAADSESPAVEGKRIRPRKKVAKATPDAAKEKELEVAQEPAKKAPAKKAAPKSAKTEAERAEEPKAEAAKEEKSE